MLLLAVVRSGRLEDESEHQTEDGQRLSEGEAENGDRLQHAASLGLTGDTVDVGGEDQSDADTGADGREAVADDGNVSTDVDGTVHVVLFRSWCPHGTSPSGSLWVEVSARRPASRRCRWRRAR